MKKMLILILSVFFISCSTTGPNSSKYHHDQDDYEKMVIAHSVEKEKIEGLYNVFSVKATLLNSQIQMLQLNKKGHDFLWNDGQYDQERSKLLDDQKNQTQFFISFFTPKSKHDDLDLGASIWRLYLEVEGKRYSGKIQKYPGTYEQVHSFFPTHTQWATAYLVSFPVSILSIESQEMKLIVTGPLGHQTLEFIK